MKQVVTASSVTHLWANQAQYEARTPQGNFYFRGDTIYSYGSHFPIAKHITNGTGVNAVLFTERTYSNTTAKHIHAVRHACNHLEVIPCYNPESSHKENFGTWQNEAENIAKQLLNARKPEIYLSRLDSIRSKVEKYANFFRLNIPKGLQAALSITNAEQYATYSKKKSQYLAAEYRREQRERQAKIKQELEDWLTFKRATLYNRDGKDYLRFNEATNEIQTSQGIHLTTDAGKRIYESILNQTLKVGDVVLDHYNVLKVNGTIKIGCHDFDTSYLLQFGSKLYAGKVN